MYTEILSLLRSKNRCLKQLIEISTEFEKLDLTDESIDKTIDNYNKSRSATMKAIELFDKAFFEKFNQFEHQLLSDLTKEEIKAEQSKAEILFYTLTDINLNISFKIQESLEALSKKSSELIKNKTTIGKFHSSSLVSEEIDTTI